MTWSWRLSEISKRSGQGKSEVEWIVLPRDAKPEKACEQSGDPKKWGARAQAQIRAAMKGEKETPLVIAIRHADGTLSAILSLDLAKPKAVWMEKFRDACKQLVAVSGGEKALVETGVRWSFGALAREAQKEVLSAAAFVLVTRDWQPTRFGTEAAQRPAKFMVEVQPVASLDTAAQRKAIDEGSQLGRANNRLRTWAALPFSHLTPGRYRDELRAHAREHGLGFEFLGRAQLAKLKAGSFLSVLAADPKSEGGIVRLSYRPKGAKGAPIALVGKGLCYDTGGYNLKPGSSMLGMHRDMTGSALVAAFIGFLKESGYPGPVDAYCALAANLISETAVTANQVVTAMDGTSIEIVDTDAEGRLVLADTLAYVRRQKPKLILDFATLTGATLRALGRKRASVFSNREELGRLAVQAGIESGERTWNFPIGEEYAADLESPVADLLQCADNNYSDHIYAATFLSRFVGPDIPWVHVDIAGPEHVPGGLGLVSSDITGYGILWSHKFLSLHEG